MTDMLSAPVLVLADLDTDADGAAPLPTSAAADLLAGAATLSSQVIALVTGVGSALPEQTLAALGQAGATSVLVADVSALAAASADAVVAAAAQTGPAVVLVTSDYRGKELAGRAAVLLGSACASDLAEVRLEDGAVVASKMVLSGSWTTTVAATPDTSRPAVLAVRPGAFEAAGVTAPAGGAPVQASVLEVTLSAQAAAVTLVDRQVEASAGGPSLAEAATVVVGGRGVDGDFDLVRSLAEPLGAAVGATRVACDEGWIERSAQVGQTGASIAPRLYIGLGVSGAVHHTSGIQGAGTIVAVCDDSEAPIFEMADYGVVGDVREVVPQLVAELARLKA